MKKKSDDFKLQNEEVNRLNEEIKRLNEENQRLKRFYQDGVNLFTEKDNTFENLTPTNI